MKRRTFNNQHGIASDFVLVIIALPAILFLAAWVALNNTKVGPDDAATAESIPATVHPTIS
jgi:hypothetical protein